MVDSLLEGRLLFLVDQKQTSCGYSAASRGGATREVGRDGEERDAVVGRVSRNCS